MASFPEPSQEWWNALADAMDTDPAWPCSLDYPAPGCSAYKAAALEMIYMRDLVRAAQ